MTPKSSEQSKIKSYEEHALPVVPEHFGKKSDHISPFVYHIPLSDINFGLRYLYNLSIIILCNGPDRVF